MTPSPPRDAAALSRAARALADFFRLEAAGGIVLVCAAALALFAANSPWADVYARLLAWPLGSAGLGLRKPLLWWINDGLMAVFFLLVALEIKREARSGALSGRGQLWLPLACATAGVAVPALLFAAFNRGDPATLRGWAVPTATDIAFALGVLALLGPRVPLGMKLLLSTIAVVDDLIAILIIAMFYAQGLSFAALAAAVAVLAAMWLLNRRGVRALAPYLLLGALLWACVLASGVHPTLAGVATGLMIPHDDGETATASPLERLEHALHPWVAYAILPLFAFANAGLALGGASIDALRAGLPAGIIAGLVLGKPVGIVGAALLLRAGGMPLPRGMDVRALVGLGMLCGIGFTMSLFIASLAYHDAARYEAALLGVLCASLAAALLGYAWLSAVLPRAPGPEAR